MGTKMLKDGGNERARNSAFALEDVENEVSENRMLECNGGGVGAGSQPGIVAFKAMVMRDEGVEE